MKRIIITFAAVAIASVASAQMLFSRSTDIELPQAVADSVSATNGAAADSLWWDRQPRLRLVLGLAAGVNLFSTDNQLSPYYSRHGLRLEVPLMLSYQVSPHWRLSTGVQVELNYNPLYYNVDLHMVDDGNGYSYSDGLDFGDYAGTSDGKQHAYTYFGYVGIPLQATWYPWARERRVLGVSADLYAGYAFVRHIGLDASYAERYADGSIGIDNVDHAVTQNESLLRWKLELGLGMQTDLLGLLHGVRFFVNLLPSYRDPVTGEGLFLHGMTLYL